MKSLNNIKILKSLSRPSQGKLVRWLTWSQEFLDFVYQAKKDGQLPKRVRLSQIRGCEPYDATYELVPSSGMATLQEPLNLFARSLSEFDLGKQLWLLDGMINEVITSKDLPIILSALRWSICAQAKDQRAALVSPPKPERQDKGFPLHADLFICEKLLLIFDSIPADGSGASTFMDIDTLEILVRRAGVNVKARRQISRLLRSRLQHDGFNQLFELLHGAENDWCTTLAHTLEQEQFVIHLERGQGYLLADRYWLHGRLASSAPVTTTRFRRLVFGI